MRGCPVRRVKRCFPSTSTEQTRINFFPTPHFHEIFPRVLRPLPECATSCASLRTLCKRNGLQTNSILNLCRVNLNCDIFCLGSVAKPADGVSPSSSPCQSDAKFNKLSQNSTTNLMPAVIALAVILGIETMILIIVLLRSVSSVGFSKLCFFAIRLGTLEDNFPGCLSQQSQVT